MLLLRRSYEPITSPGNSGDVPQNDEPMGLRYYSDFASTREGEASCFLANATADRLPERRPRSPRLPLLSHVRTLTAPYTPQSTEYWAAFPYPAGSEGYPVVFEFA